MHSNTNLTNHSDYAEINDAFTMEPTTCGVNTTMALYDDVENPAQMHDNQQETNAGHLYANVRQVEQTVTHGQSDEQHYAKPAPRQDNTYQNEVVKVYQTLTIEQ